MEFTMALYSTSDLIALESNLDLLFSRENKLSNIITELQGLTVSLGTGAGANTNIAITNIATTDTLLGVFEIPAATTTLVDRTATSSITSAGNIQCTQSTSGNQVMVFWYNKA